MSNERRAAFGGDAQKNPATKFLYWKSDKKCFEYFDSEKAKTMEGQDKDTIKTACTVDVKLPFNFIALKQLQSVKGWSDALSGSIISNEVEFVTKQELNVVCYHKNVRGESTKTTIAKGLYSNIKEAVVTAGAKYHKSIYIILEDGTLANIQLKGAAVKEWGDFFNRSKNRLVDEWVSVEKTVEGKKGAVKYNMPVFTLKRSLTEEEANNADSVYNELNEYLKQYFDKTSINNIEVNEPEVLEPETTEQDDLEF